jgi:hypothetical protein
MEQPTFLLPEHFALLGMEECNMTVWARGKMFRHPQGAFPSPKLQLSSGGINFSYSVPEWCLTYISKQIIQAVHMTISYTLVVLSRVSVLGQLKPTSF